MYLTIRCRKKPECPEGKTQRQRKKRQTHRMKERRRETCTSFVTAPLLSLASSAFLSLCVSHPRLCASHVCTPPAPDCDHFIAFYPPPFALESLLPSSPTCSWREIQLLKGKKNQKQKAGQMICRGRREQQHSRLRPSSSASAWTEQQHGSVIHGGAGELFLPQFPKWCSNFLLQYFNHWLNGRGSVNRFIRAWMSYGDVFGEVGLNVSAPFTSSTFHLVWTLNWLLN